MTAGRLRGLLWHGLAQHKADVGAADIHDSTAAAIHLRVPRDVKGRWAARSRAAGQKLGDWIVDRVEAACDDNAGSTDGTQTGR